ncbi:MAG: lipopolysaccharide transport system ATP-binding protein [Acidobacteriota bacterium]|jgi:lipopolysaccharide transport system ATP-binding protein|nr:lipopolysaccharide transport system ATP-binding protein [Acidobacteriota bacterium]
MTSDAVLAVSHLSKKYCRELRRALWYGVVDTARELLPSARALTLRAGEFLALDDVSFDVRAGDALAVIGANGAGKSTLLRILYGLLKPDGGEVRLRGRVEALIELGTGFNPLLTGRENIGVGAALYGLTRRETDVLAEEVVEFAEVAEAIDAPVQSYSSGMKARLAYALAAHLKPDILLVDEVLAVGDAAFQRKCVSHMNAYLERGGALLFVSHNTHQIQSLCNRGILLERGRLTFTGTAVETLNRMFEQRLGATPGERVSAPAIGPIVITEVLAEPLQRDEIRSGEPLRITIRYRADEPVDVAWGFSIWTADQWVCVCGESDLTRRTLPSGDGELTCVIPRLPLVGGRYSLRAAIQDFETKQPLALYGWHDAAATLDVRSDATLLGNAQMELNQLVRVDVEWS